MCPSLLLYFSLDNKVNKPIPSSPVSAIYGLYRPTGRAYGPYGPTGRGYGPTGLRARALRLTGPPTGRGPEAYGPLRAHGPTGHTGPRAGPTGLRARALGPPGVNGPSKWSTKTHTNRSSFHDIGIEIEEVSAAAEKALKVGHAAQDRLVQQFDSDDVPMLLPFPETEVMKRFKAENGGWFFGSNGTFNK